MLVVPARSRGFGRPLDTPADVVARQSAMWRAMLLACVLDAV
jgi:hypothetical protein